MRSGILDEPERTVDEFSKPWRGRIDRSQKGESKYYMKYKLTLIQDSAKISVMVTSRTQL